ncbi:hypothetical protein CWC15_17250 [Pseudoalteromonas spongiae]|nr:hypothetical protein CWC15_17250 [Pseudoalteromonas spongiae]
MSLSGGLLRLMMTGLIFVMYEPTNSWLNFLLSELIGYLSTQPKEGMLMIVKVLREAKSCVYKLKDVIASQGFRHPYRFNLLTIW